MYIWKETRALRFSVCLFFKEQYRFFLAGGAIRPVDVANPATEWITERIWSEILTLESLEQFKGFAQNFHTYLQDFKQIFDSSEPERYVQRYSFILTEKNPLCRTVYSKCFCFKRLSQPSLRERKKNNLLNSTRT